MNENLRLFFASIQKQGKNAAYKKNAYVNLRYGLSKFIKAECGWDIGEDPAFISSHDIFSAVCTKLKKTGYGETTHYPPIEPEDLYKLYRGEHFAFDIHTPVGLFQKVWYEICFYLCRRGRENAREMTRDTFKMGKDASGRQFVYQAVGEVDKNHTASDKPDDTIGEGRYYSNDVRFISNSNLRQYLNDSIFFVYYTITNIIYFQPECMSFLETHVALFSPSASTSANCTPNVMLCGSVQGMIS